MVNRSSNKSYTLSGLQINSNTCKKYRFTRVLLQVSEHLLKYESESIPTFLEVHFSESGIWNPNPESKMRIHFSNICNPNRNTNYTFANPNPNPKNDFLFRRKESPIPREARRKKHFLGVLQGKIHLLTDSLTHLLTHSLTLAREARRKK